MCCLNMPKAKFSRSDSQSLNQHQLLSDVKPNCLLASCRSIMLAAVFAKTSHHTLFHNVPVSLEVRCLKFKQGYVLEIVYNLFLVLLSMSISNFFLISIIFSTLPLHTLTFPSPFIAYFISIDDVVLLIALFGPFSLLFHSVWRGWTRFEISLGKKKILIGSSS